MARPGMPGIAPIGVVPQNPLHITFKNSEWPANFITPENVLDYFCNTANGFYDTSCNNQHIKMQNLNDRPLEENLIKTVGIQYVLWSAQPPLYVICKHRRNSPQNGLKLLVNDGLFSVTPLAYYYIINGTVYQAPDMYTFTQSRMLAIVDPLKKAFDEVMSFSRYNIAKGYHWQFKNKPADEDEKEEEKPLQARKTHFQVTRTEMLLKNLFAAFPLDEPEKKIKPDDDTQSIRSGSTVVRPADGDSNIAQKRPR